MKVNKETFSEVHQPVYVLEEARLRRNLALIKRVADEADVEIILAFKAFALWKTFPIFREYIHATTASSLYEARLGYEDFGAPVHTFTPALSDDEAPASRPTSPSTPSPSMRATIAPCSRPIPA